MEVDFEGGSIIDDFLSPKEYNEIFRTIRNEDFPYGFIDQVIGDQVDKFDYYFANMVSKRYAKFPCCTFNNEYLYSKINEIGCV